jgi:signal transduction histidine kinase
VPEREDRYTRADAAPALIAPGLDEAERLAALQETALLDAPAEEAFDRFTRLESRLINVPIAAINLITDERQVLLSECGIGEPWGSRRQMPLSYSFCQHVVSSGAPVVTADARTNPLLHDNLAVSELDVIAYAGVPLFTAERQVLGAFCITQPEPREWTNAELEVLRDLAAAVMSEIELRVTRARFAAQRTFLTGVIENLHDAVYAVDPSGTPVLKNEALYVMQGLPQGQARDLQRYHDWVRIYEADGTTELTMGTSPIYRALHGERVVREPFVIVLHGSGIRREVEISSAPIVTPEGVHLGAVSASRDVTAARAAERAREEFFALVSHELRTPLAAITGYLEMLEEVDGERLSDDGRDFLRILDRNSQRLLRVIGDLLFAAQIEAGTMHLVVQDVGLRELVTDTVTSAGPRAAGLDVSLTSQVSDDVPETIRGDPGRLAQVLDNLVSNALKFTPAGGSIEVGAHIVDGSVRLTVTDTGIGIPAEEQPRLFERFERARAATEGAVQGVGLGLAICRAIVEGHDGRISLESAPGEGTTFIVELPARQAPGAAPDEAKEAHAS